MAPRRRIDAISLLTDEHRKLKAVLVRFVRAQDAAERITLLNHFRRALDGHTVVEHEVFYPAYIENATNGRHRRAYFEAEEEHRVIADVLRELMHTRPHGDAFAGKARFLQSLVRYHCEREERAAFAEARRILSPAGRRDLGTGILNRRQEYALVESQLMEFQDETATRARPRTGRAPRSKKSRLTRRTLAK